VLTVQLTKALFPGPSVPITFTFANAGSVTLRVPVQLTEHTGPVGISVPALETSSVPD
jgi:copper(I)-binding protein